MKKKILFMVINMNIGGTEKALLNMISVMPKDKYDITILLLERKGGFLSYIPDHVHVECLKEYSKIKEQITSPPMIVIKQNLTMGKIIKTLNLTFLYLLSKVKRERSSFYNYLLRKTPMLQTEYDLAVAYAGPMDFISFFVVKKIKAKKKIQWIHFDVRRIGFNKHFANKFYKYFNKILVVSKEGKEVLSNIIPTIKNRIDHFPNILSKNQILKMSEEGIGFEDIFTGFRILTVGRLSREKGQDLTIPVLARLKKDGYNLRWYCIGDGNARKEYKKMIDDYGLQNDYFLLGAKLNPYPFMKQCDIYVQPSRHEGYCITIAEAKYFGNPIVATRFTGVSEHITHEQNGLITDYSEHRMYKDIKRLLDDENLRHSIKRNQKSTQFDAKNNIDDLYKLF